MSSLEVVARRRRVCGQIERNRVGEGFIRQTKSFRLEGEAEVLPECRVEQLLSGEAVALEFVGGAEDEQELEASLQLDFDRVEVGKERMNHHGRIAKPCLGESLPRKQER